MKNVAWMAAMIVVATASAVFGQSLTNYWSNNAGGDFSTASNWKLGLPGSNDVVVFNHTSAVPYTVTLSQTVTNLLLAVKKDKFILDLNGYNYTLLFNTSIVSVLRSGEIGMNSGENADLLITNSVAGSTNTLEFQNKLQIGYSTGSGVGRLDVTGSNTSLKVHTVGTLASCRLAVDNRGNLVLRNGAKFNTYGNTANVLAGSTVNLDGPGTEWTCAALSFAGYMTLSNGAALLWNGTGNLILSLNSGRIIMDNARINGRRWHIGDTGNGHLELKNGSVLEAQNYWVYVGGQYSYLAKSTITMTGTNTTISFVNLSGGVFVGGMNESATGPGGTGELRMGEGTRILNQVTVWPLGFVECAGLCSNRFRNFGTVSPGWPIGTMTVTNSVFFNTQGGTNGTLRFDIGGAQDGQYDRLVVHSNIVFGGTCNVVLTNGYVPKGGDVFNLLDWSGSISGKFATVSLPDLPSGRLWNTNRLYSAGELGVDLRIAKGALILLK